MKDEALRLALEALEVAELAFGHPKRIALMKEAITAIKQALAQPEPEYAIRLVAHGAEPVLGWSQHWSNFPINTKFYTSPPKREWQGLTEEERRECTQSPFTAENYRAIEAKLKEKNT